MLFAWELSGDLGDSLARSGVDPDTAKAVIKEFATIKYWRKRAKPARENFIRRAETTYFETRNNLQSP